MSTSQAILYPNPPPTTNDVEPKQRLRLKRSTKKLGALLGTTPRVAEPDHKVPFPKSSKRGDTLEPVKSRRQRSIFTRSSSPEEGYASSTTSVASLSLSRNSSIVCSHDVQKSTSKPRRTIDIPRPLVLHLNVPSHHDLPPTPSTADTLTPSSASCGITPITPVFPTPAESRRKRMAKLTRTLGEIVPPQLVFASRKPSSSNVNAVFPEKAHPVESTNDAGRRRSMSVDFSGTPDHPFDRSSKVWVTNNSTWRGEWNRKDIRVVQNELRSLRLR